MNINPIIINSLLISLGFILCDSFLGIILSVKNKEFQIEELPRFLSTAILPYIGGLIILGIFANYIVDLMPIFLTAVGLVNIKFGVEIIKQKVIKLFV